MAYAPALYTQSAALRSIQLRIVLWTIWLVIRTSYNRVIVFMAPVNSSRWHVSNHISALYIQAATCFVDKIITISMDVFKTPINVLQWAFTITSTGQPNLVCREIVHGVSCCQKGLRQKIVLRHFSTFFKSLGKDASRKSFPFAPAAPPASCHILLRCTFRNRGICTPVSWIFWHPSYSGAHHSYYTLYLTT